MEENSYELDITWEQLEEQARANEAKENPTTPRPKKLV